MYVTVESFVKDYLYEIESTQKLLDTLTDASLGQVVAHGYRTLGHLAWHIVPAGGVLDQIGLKYESPDGNNPPPTSASAIANAYRSASKSLVEAVKKQWKDEDLQIEQDMWGVQWKIGYSLLMFVKHEVHHRGQLTILMRQAGLPVTGVYGPSKEEWAYSGVEAPAY